MPNVTYTDKDNSASIGTPERTWRDSDANEIKDVVNLKAEIYSASNSVFVSKDGSDSTGARERPDLPFLTINAAVAAASSGDTVIVYPGDYTVTAALPIETGINYTFLGKGTVTLGTAATNSNIFKNAAATTASSVVFAPGWNFTVTDIDDGIYYQVGSGESSFTFNEINHIASTGAAYCIRLDGTGVLNVKGKKVTHMGNGQCLYIQGSGSNNPTMRATVDHLENNNENCIYVDFGSMFLDYKKILRTSTTNTNYLISINTASVNEIFLRGQYTYCGNGWVIYTEGASEKIFLECDYIEGGGTCTVVGSTAGGGHTTVRAGTIANHRATGTYGILHAEGGPLTVIGARVVRIGPGGGYDAKTTSASILRLIGVSYNTSAITESIPYTIVDENLLVVDDNVFNGSGTRADPLSLIPSVYEKNVNVVLNGTFSVGETATIDLTTLPSTAKKVEVYFELIADSFYDWRFRIEREGVGSIDTGASDYNTTTSIDLQVDLGYGKLQADCSRLQGRITIINPKDTGRLMVQADTWGIDHFGDATKVLQSVTYLLNAGALKKIQILSSGTGFGGSVDISSGNWFAEYSQNNS